MKPINRKKQASAYKLYAFVVYLFILYFACHMGYVTQGEPLSQEMLVAAIKHCTERPWELFPTDMKLVGVCAIFGFIGPLLIYSEYLRNRDTRPMEESGSAKWTEDFKKFYLTYTEMTGWPKIFDKNKFLRKVKGILTKINVVLSKIPVIRIINKKIVALLEKQFLRPTVSYSVLPKGYDVQEEMEEIEKQFKVDVETLKYPFSKKAKPTVPDVSIFSKNMIFTKNIYMSMDIRKTRRNNNFMVIGGSGAGKSRFVIKPNLLQANCSYVITDPSGELLESMGGFLLSQGYDIRVFNLVDMAHSSCYNPFHYIRNQEGVFIMINALIKNTTPKGSSPSEPFWEKAETALLQAICFYLWLECDKTDQNFSSVMKLLRCASAVEGQEDVKSTLDILMDDLEEKMPNNIACRQYAIFKSAGGGKTAQSILISCLTRLQTFDLDAIQSLTNIDNINLGNIGDEKVALFCITPSADTTFNFLVALLYTQLFETLYYHAENECKGKRLKSHVRFMLDEFANIGTIPDFAQKLSTMRKYEISCTIVIQALSQIKAMYKDDWDVLVGNCDSFLFLGGADETSLKYVSDMLGKETISSINRSRSYGKQGSHSLSYNKTGRELLTTTELRTMDNENCVLFIRGLDPFFEEKYPLEKHPNYRISGDGNEKMLFDVKAMLETGKAMNLQEKMRQKQLEESSNFREQVRESVNEMDPREAKRREMEQARRVSRQSDKNKELLVPQPLEREFPGFHKPVEERTPEEREALRQAEAAYVHPDGRKLTPEEEEQKKQEDFMAMYGGSEQEEEEMPNGYDYPFDNHSFGMFHEKPSFTQNSEVPKNTESASETLNNNLSAQDKDDILNEFNQ